MENDERAQLLAQLARLKRANCRWRKSAIAVLAVVVVTLFLFGGFAAIQFSRYQPVVQMEKARAEALQAQAEHNLQDAVATIERSIERLEKARRPR